MLPLERSWPQTFARDELALSREFLQLRVTAVNKLAELDTERGRATPLSTSPVMSLMGVIKHLTNAYAHLIQETARHVGHLDILREMADGRRGE
jgi:hypothetical protein